MVRLKTLDEERKERAFYEAMDGFAIPIDIQNIIWEHFLARCACGRCEGIPTYNKRVVTTPLGRPILWEHSLESRQRCHEQRCYEDILTPMVPYKCEFIQKHSSDE